MSCRMTPLVAFWLASSAAIAQQVPPGEEPLTFDFSGELRERFESVRNPLFGLASPDDNDYLLHRVMLSGELRHVDNLRVFAQVVSGFTSGWAGSPPTTQDDELDLLQAYVEPVFPVGGARLALRLGRQEMSFGAARLVSVRESPNIRRTFDGIRAIWTRDRRSASAFFVRPVFPEQGVFDDQSSDRQRFWGLYASDIAERISGLKFDVYYLGLDRADAEFAVGVAHERRHTVGVRWFGARVAWDWNIETAGQWGSFGASNISAWTASMDVGYEFAANRLPFRIGLKADAASGDRNPDDRELGTFNPLFPKLSYFSEANLATPANLLDLQPNVRLSLTDRLRVHASWDALWKHEAADAFYAPPLTAVDGTSLSKSREIGWQASLLIEWQMTEQIEFGATYVFFEPRAVAVQAQGSAGRFVGAWLRCTF